MATQLKSPPPTKTKNSQTQNELQIKLRVTTIIPRINLPTLLLWVSNTLVFWETYPPIRFSCHQNENNLWAVKDLLLVNKKH